MKRARNSAGFTILELLVVVLIVALLLAVALPAIGKARGDAGVQGSMANLVTLDVATSGAQENRPGGDSPPWVSRPLTGKTHRLRWIRLQRLLTTKRAQALIENGKKCRRNDRHAAARFSPRSDPAHRRRGCFWQGAGRPLGAAGRVVRRHREGLAIARSFRDNMKRRLR